jgi:hypothetical protein
MYRVCGVGNLARSRLLAGIERRGNKSRLKGGCSHDWLPHVCQVNGQHSTRDFLDDALE